MKTFEDVIFEGEAIDFHKERLQNAKQKLMEIQKEIENFLKKEREAKIEFLKALELGEEYMNWEGDKFLFVGFQIRPDPVALVEWPGGICTMQLDCIKERFLTEEELDREARSFKVSPCNKCGGMIPSEMQICSKCQEKEEKDTYPCPICKKEIPGTEPFCQDCSKDFEEARKAA